MNVVGKVGSLISQGVYSVATPFHPFGGAVDVVVVQQQDGTFRSTPWYVRFGKFQGVLKGAEKIVRISVNGVEANFHMYLDNSGEAYFVREVDSGKGSETNEDLQDSDNMELTCEDSGLGDNRNNFDVCRLEHSVSDSGVAQLKDERDPCGADGLERAESDVGLGFYEFEDGQSSLEGSVEVSEFATNRYESLDGENSRDAQGSDSEVVLVSVDGHVLTAPISASEQNTENVQLSTPQFHLGPGEGAEFCEDNVEFSSSENAWAVDYISKLNYSAVNTMCDEACSLNNDNNALRTKLESCENLMQNVYRAERIENISNQEGDPQIQSESEDACTRIRREDVFKSCLELSELAEVEKAELAGIDCSLELQCSQDLSAHRLPLVNEIADAGIVESKDVDVCPPSASSDFPDGRTSLDLKVEVGQIEKNASSGVEPVGLGTISPHSNSNDPDLKDHAVGSSAAPKVMDGSLQRPVRDERPITDECSNSEIVESKTAVSSEQTNSESSIRFEISLCGNELRAGMGLDAAAEAFDAHRITIDEFKNAASSIIKNENLIIRFGERYLSWEKAAPLVLGMVAFDLDFPIETKDAIPVGQDDMTKLKEEDSEITSTPTGRRWRLWPIPFRRVKTLEHTSSNSSSEEVFVDSESGLQSTQVETPPASTVTNMSPRKQLIRTNVPTSEQIASLNLKDGQNMVTFSFCTRVLGMQQVEAYIYLWKWNARIVISDVDGTITKSDVLGQFMPLVGRDWTQSGVARLFSAIKENGYQLLFLSARAIVQAYLTRSFLLNLKQDGKNLPSGPVVISPDGLFPSLYREVIRRAPHEFKIACLEDIKKLFPSDYNPFYAGFGNRDTDELSYLKIGIPKGKIFIINPKGEVAISHRIDVKSYTSLHTLVNDMFPPTSMVEQEDFNSWNFWKVPLPDFEG